MEPQHPPLGCSQWVSASLQRRHSGFWEPPQKMTIDPPFLALSLSAILWRRLSLHVHAFPAWGGGWENSEMKFKSLQFAACQQL